MARRTAPKVTTSTPLGRTVDQSQETVRDKNDRPIDEAYVQELVEAARRAPGRPSLAKGTGQDRLSTRPRSTRGPARPFCVGRLRYLLPPKPKRRYLLPPKPA